MRMSSLRRGRPRHGGEAGFTLVEVVVSLALVLLTSLSMVYTFTSAGSASHSADRAVAVQLSLEDTVQVLDDQPFEQLLTWNAVERDYGDHTVTIAANLAQVGLVMVELTATDDRTGTVLGRLASYRAGDV